MLRRPSYPGYLCFQSFHMTWNNHIDNTAAKAKKKPGFLKRSCYCSANSRVLYNMFDPHNKTQAATIENVQRRAAHWVTGRFHNMLSVSDMLSDLGWRDLNHRRVDSRLCMAYKIVHDLVAILLARLLKFREMVSTSKPYTPSITITCIHSSPILSTPIYHPPSGTIYLETLFPRNP